MVPLPCSECLVPPRPTPPQPTDRSAAHHRATIPLPPPITPCTESMISRPRPLLLPRNPRCATASNTGRSRPTTRSGRPSSGGWRRCRREGCGESGHALGYGTRRRGLRGEEFAAPGELGRPAPVGQEHALAGPDDAVRQHGRPRSWPTGDPRGRRPGATRRGTFPLPTRSRGMLVAVVIAHCRRRALRQRHGSPRSAAPHPQGWRRGYRLGGGNGAEW